MRELLVKFDEKMATRLPVREAAMDTRGHFGLISWDDHGNITDANEAFLNLAGYTRDDLLEGALTMANLTAPEYRWHDQRLRQELAAAGSCVPFEGEYVHKDGRRIPVLVGATLFDGLPEKPAAFVVDMTQRKRTEDVQRRIERERDHLLELLQMQIERMPIGYLLADADLRYTYWNPAAEKIFGFSREEVVGKHPFDLIVPPQSQLQVASDFRRLAAGDMAAHGCCENVTKNGRTIVCEWRNTPLLAADGSFVGLLSMPQDITHRMEAEEELQKYAAVIENSRDFVALASVEGKVVFINDAGRKLIGLSDEAEIVTKLIPDFYAQEELAQLWKTILPATSETGHWEGETRLNHFQDGKPIDVHMSLFVVKHPQTGEALGLATVARDITTHKRAEDALRHSEQRYRNLVEAAQDAIFTVAPDGTFTSISPGFERMTGWARTEWIGRSLDLLLHAEDAPFVSNLMRHAFTGETLPPFEARVLKQEGDHAMVECTTTPQVQDGVVVGVLGIARDITERKRLEEQFRQSQKMEAVGRLAGGVAHDFNNLLTIITGYSDIILGTLPKENPMHGFITEIKSAGERAAGLTRQLLAFSRKQRLEPVVLNLNSVVTNMDKMLRRLIGEDVDLETVLDPTLRQVRADPGQIEQVLMNLAVNSRDAMPQGGELTIETANVNLDRAYAQNHADVRPGEYVMLAVHDNGVGMDAKTKARVFEPFFTTKPAGQGTGLGLATVYGIIKQSGGHIEVFSELRRGTTFKIYLPRIKEAASLKDPQEASADCPGGTETILLVEDEDGVRQLIREVLQRNGYTVLEAQNGREGLRICQQCAGVIHLLVTDVVMPQMSGGDLAQQVLLLRPQIKFLHISGYTDDALAHQGVMSDGAGFLHKPFTAAVLARRVRQILDDE